jgi:hypothetical protein
MKHLLQRCLSSSGGSGKIFPRRKRPSSDIRRQSSRQSTSSNIPTINTPLVRRRARASVRRRRWTPKTVSRADRSLTSSRRVARRMNCSQVCDGLKKSSSWSRSRRWRSQKLDRARERARQVQTPRLGTRTPSAPQLGEPTADPPPVPFRTFPPRGFSFSANRPHPSMPRRTTPLTSLSNHINSSSSSDRRTRTLPSLFTSNPSSLAAPSSRIHSHRPRHRHRDMSLPRSSRHHLTNPTHPIT